MNPTANSRAVAGQPARPSPAASEHSSGKLAPKPASWAYAEDFKPEDDARVQARAAARRLNVPAVSRGTAALLTFVARSIAAKAVVEVGSGTGVSGLALFAGMTPNGILTSIDVEQEHQLEARKAFVSAGIPTQRFRLIAGAALTVLPKLSDGAYDLVFVDADLLEYVEYLAQARRLLRNGGIVVLNNALWHDLVADPANADDETVILREALTSVLEAEDFLPVLLPVGDGVLLALKQ